MENTGSVESNSKREPIKILLSYNEESRAYIRGLEEAGDTDSLKELLKQVEDRYQIMSDRYLNDNDYQHISYLLSEIKQALEPDLTTE